MPAVADDSFNAQPWVIFCGAAAGSGDGIGEPRINRAAITASITCATIMQGVDTTIANVSRRRIFRAASPARKTRGSPG